MLHVKKTDKKILFVILLTTAIFIATSMIAAADAYALSGRGTAEEPYQISNLEDWETFAGEVSAGNSKGKYYELTGNVVGVHTMIGTASHPFEGSLDGKGKALSVDILTDSGGAAPFAFVGGATIKNLNVTGVVIGGKHSAGLVGRVKDSTLKIEGVEVNTAIQSEQHLGGFIGHSEGNSVCLTDCIFSGQLDCSGGHGYAGGFAGWCDTPGYTIKECLFKGRVTGEYDHFHPTGLYYPYGGSGHYGSAGTNVYYTASGAVRGSGSDFSRGLNSNWAKLVRVYEPDELKNDVLQKRLLLGQKDTGCYRRAQSCGVNISGAFVTREEGDAITPDTKIEFDSNHNVDHKYFNIKYYKVADDGKTTEVAADSIREAGNYRVTVTGKNSGDQPYFFGTQSADFKVMTFGSGEGTKLDPYLLFDSNDWKAFAEAVNNGYSFKGEYVSLANYRVEAKVPAGTKEHPFEGTFDSRNQYGENRKLTVELDDTSMEGLAPFRYVGNGAVIKNTDVVGTVKGGQYSAGLVGFAWSGTVEIDNVKVATNLLSGSHVGGIVGNGRRCNMSITNSVYTGEISGGSSFAGGIQGWCEAQTLTMKNCMFSGTFKGAGAFHPIAVKAEGWSIHPTANRIYYIGTQPPKKIDATNTVTNGTPVYTKTEYPENRLVSRLQAADGKYYYAATKAKALGGEYIITAGGIAPVPTVSGVEGDPLANGKDYTALYTKSGAAEPVEKIIEEGIYTVALEGNGDRTLGRTVFEGSIIARFTDSSHVTGVTLDERYVTLGMDEDANTVQLVETIEPVTAVNREVVWSSSNESVATVDQSGLVTAKDLGTATITVTAKDDALGVKTATCRVSVGKREAKVIVPPSKNLLTYDGTSQDLVNPGTAAGGTLVYGEFPWQGDPDEFDPDEIDPDDIDFSEDLPAEAHAGNYVVAYYAWGDAYHDDSDVEYMLVTIAKAQGGAEIRNSWSMSPEETKDLRELIDGNTSGGVEFAIKDDGETNSDLTEGGVFTAGTYGTCIVTATVKERRDYEALTEDIRITIPMSELRDPYAGMTGWTYGEAGNDPTYTIPGVEPEDVTILYIGKTRSGASYGDDDTEAVTRPTEAGIYTVFVMYGGGGEFWIGTADFAIAPKSIDGAEVTFGKTLTYTGEAQEQTIEKVMLGDSDITQYCVNGGNQHYDPAEDESKFTVVDAGDYDFVVTANETSNYTGSIKAPFTVAKANPEIVTAPKEIEGLEYNGCEQELIVPGEVVGGVLTYTASGSGFSEKTPVGLNAGTYRILYRVKGDRNHNDLYTGGDDQKYIDVTMSGIPCTVDTAPQAVADLVYTGEEQALVTEGASSDGAMVYRLGAVENAAFSTEIPTAKDAGTYEVYFKAAPRDVNHEDSAVQGPVEVTVGPGQNEVTKAPEAVENLTYDGEEQALVTAGEVLGGVMMYRLGEDGEFSENIPTAVGPGSYDVYYKAGGDDNYAESDISGPVNVSIGTGEFPGSITQPAIMTKVNEQIDIKEYVISDKELEYSITNQDPESMGCTLEGSKFKAGEAEGTCIIEIKVKDDNSYNPKSISVNVSNVDFTEIEVKQDDIIYGKGTIEPEYTNPDGEEIPKENLMIMYFGTLLNGTSYGDDDEEFVNAPTEAGTYTVLVMSTTDNEAYLGTKDFLIKAADIKEAAVTLGDRISYNGEEQTQEVAKVEFDGKDITSLCDVTGNKVTKTGNYELTVSAKEDAYNYFGSVKAKFTVYPDAVTLKTAKEDAVKELDKKYKLSQYSGKEKTIVANAIAAAKKAISQAETLEDIEAAKAAAEKTISACKKVNTLKAKGKKIKAKFSKLKSKTLKYKKTKAVKVTAPKGKVTYKRSKITAKKKLLKQAKKKIKVAKSGKITLKKGLKKGTYKVKVIVRAAGNKYYKAAKKTVTVKITVK